MNAMEKTALSVIQQKDPLFAKHPHLDFQFLRQEGMLHIGALSGKIWTDHNTHDPGITILEVLCYALMDLGYRTQLDVVDLIATPSNAAETFHTHDNFFTPLEILSCNPTTITDYRKLILEVPGVRNAWLEPNRDQALTLLDAEIKTPILLNGLYDIHIETEDGADEEAIASILCELLSEHRNLGEDFQKLSFLKPCPVGISASIELTKTTTVEEVYVQILEAVRAYISPEIRYYTLKELLDKGKRIEDVFAGRPYHEESYGFVDTAELLNLPLRHTLYASDIYQAILKIPGVSTVKQLAFNAPDAKNESDKNIPYLCIPKDCIAQFELDLTEISFSIAGEKIDFDKNIFHQNRLIQGKSKIGRKELDLPIPKGDYTPELGEYWSIQHEFPLVYGIGEGGLPADASLQRKTQALQLKAYLLFYDQLLANYLAQLSNLRHLFSLRQESKKEPDLKHTYFSQTLDNVPLIDKLLQSNQVKDLKNSLVMATPVANDTQLSQQLKALLKDGQAELKVDNYCFNQLNALPYYADHSALLRDIHIRQSIRDTEQGDYQIEVHRDKNGYFFILRFTQVSTWVLVGNLRYQTRRETREAANFATFLATNEVYYQKNNFENKDQLVYQFDLVYKPEAYASYLHYLLEDEQVYCQRREAILDHLLGRFASHFTDYSLLRFGAKTLQKKELQQSIEDKSKFLSHYDELSRNRGRAFNYLKPSWNTANVSGFEKRVAILGGLNEWKRRSLCKFEVVPSKRLVLPDLEGKPWLNSIAVYPSDQELAKAWLDLQEALRNPNRYGELKNKYSDFDALALRRMFSEIPTKENIIPGDKQFIPVLINAQGDVLSPQYKLNSITQPEGKTTPEVLAKLNVALAEEGEAIELVDIGSNSQWFLNKRHLHWQLQSQAYYTWHQLDAQGIEIAHAKGEFLDEASALADFVSQGNVEPFLQSVDHAVQWSFQIVEGINLIGKTIYAGQEEAQKAYLLVKSLGQKEQSYQIEPAPLGAIKVLLRNQKENILAEALIPAQHNIGPETLIQTCCQHFAEASNDLKYLQRGKAYIWKLDDTKGVTLLCSLEAYADAHQALRARQEALNQVTEGKNLQKKGKDVFPGYALLLFNAEGECLGTNPNAYFKTSKERDAAFKALNNELNKPSALFNILTGNTQFRWVLHQAVSGQKLYEASHTFDSPEAAMADFVACIEAELIQESSPISPHVYRIHSEEKILNHQFQYLLNSPKGEVLLRLISKEKFRYREDLNSAYAQMIRKLSQLRLQTEGGTTLLTDGGEIVLLLSEESPEQKKRAQDLLDYHQRCTQPVPWQTKNGKYIYRWLDKDHPVAITASSLKTKDDPEAFLKLACRFKPAPLDWKKSFIQVICPELHPSQFHYALCLPDEAGKDHVFLVSYVGYANKTKALAAGQEKWLDLIALAASSDNYGDGQALGLFETYSKSTHACVETEPYLAVLPSAFSSEFGENAVAVATTLAQRFPLRSSLKEETKDGKVLSVRHYTFQGFDLFSEQIIWQSPRTYPSLEAVKEAYQLFLIVLKNPNSCRIVCEEGEYHIQLWEILLESREFDSDTAAWKQLKAEIVVEVSSFTQVQVNDEYQFVLLKPIAQSYTKEVIDSEDILAIHPNRHRDISSSKRAAERTLALMHDEGIHLVEHILLRPGDEQEQECLLPRSLKSDCVLEWIDDEVEKNTSGVTKDTPKEMYYPFADPYSFWTTLVLPNWTERFRRVEDRNLFASMLHREAPALLGLHILWLNPQQMCEFEKNFRLWLDWLRNPDSICEDKGKAYCNFVNQLANLLSPKTDHAQSTSDRETAL